MIDDDVLEQLIREAAETVTPPADGPARILAARTAARSDGSGLHRVQLPRPRLPRIAVARLRAAGGALVALAVTGLLIALIATFGGAGSSSKSASSPALVHPTASAAGSAGTTAGAAGATGAPPSARSPAATGGSASPGGVSEVAPKVIQTGVVSVQVPVGEVNSTMDELTSDATALGGFVASTNAQSGPGPATGDITLRVPVADFDTLLNQVRQIGKVLSVTTSGQDVTAQYADLSAQLQSLNDTRAQYEQIMTQTTTIGAIISVEQQISQLQSQIQQLESQLQVMDSQATYGTLSVHLTQEAKAQAVVAPPSGIAKAWDHARRTFAHGLESVVSALGGIAVFLICVAALGVLARLTWGVMRRRLV